MIKYNYTPLNFKSLIKANEVLDRMRDVARIYGIVTVGDMYDISASGDTVEPIDDKHGWTEAMIKDASIVDAFYHMYRINLPNPILLETIDSEKPVTYRDKLAAEHPEKISEKACGGCFGCPKDYGYEEDIPNNCSVTTCEECWNRKYKGEKEMASVNTFKKENIKVGYVVKLRNGQFRMAMPVGKTGALILTDGDGWNYLSSWGEDLTYRAGAFVTGYPSKRGSDYAKNMDIVAIYGCVVGSDNYRHVGRIDNGGRELLWERAEPKKMTVAEIEKELGYSVEIVAEEK